MNKYSDLFFNAFKEEFIYDTINITQKLNIPKHIERPPHIIQGEKYKSSQMISFIKSQEELENLKYCSKVSSSILSQIIKKVENKELKTGIEVNNFLNDYAIKKNCYPSSFGFENFPMSLCISKNDIVCHGIPDNRPFKDGDFINFDLTLYYKGFHSDTSAMACVGKIHPKIKELIKISKNALYTGISQCMPGNKIKEIGKVIENYVEKNKKYVVKEFSGHGVGKEIHMMPLIYHHYKDIPENNENNNIVMKKGMVFTIEPIISLFRTKTLFLLPDKWGILSPGNPSSQFEHTILITEKGHEILTRREEEKYDI